MKLLLHTCCGPCFLGVWEDLSTSDFEVTNFYYNPNIFPKDEYDKRLENLKKAAEGKSKEVLVGKYDEKDYQKAVSGLELQFPKRCAKCYRLRLKETARTAKELGYDSFSTTLLVSPYQQHEELKRTGEEISRKYGIKFYYRDWRPFFRKGQNLAKESEIYRQKYCGCRFSKKESGLN